MQVNQKYWTIEGISELACHCFEPRLHLVVAVADVPRAWLKALASLDPEDSTIARGRHFRELLRTLLQSKRVHLRDRCQTGSRKPRYKGWNRRGIPR